MRWDDLRVFLAVARQGRLPTAGRVLGLDPATVGRRVTALEEALSTRLFERSLQGYALTESGRSLIVHAQAMEMQAGAATEEITGQADRLSGTVRLGAPDVALAEAQVANAEAALDRARSDAALTRLYAPIAGTVLRIHARPGDQVGADGLLELADLGRMDVVADVYETDLPRVRVGASAEVVVPGEARRYGATVREIALNPPSWPIKRDVLKAAVTPATRAIIFNNPHNPTGRLFSAEELKIIADVAIANDLIVISDEVWEHVLLDGQHFTPLASLPGMAERVIKVGSAGKIFSLTGWKVGWIVAPHELASLAAKAHQFLTFTTPPCLQVAVAYGLGKSDDYFTRMRERFARSRDRLGAGLTERGFTVLPSAGTYFLNVDIAPLGFTDDVAFCEDLVRTHGVAAIPVSAFYDADPVRHIVRLCFAKSDATLDAALDRLGQVSRRAA